MSKISTETCDDKFSNDYEEISEVASLFGIKRGLAVNLAILIELKELNRNFSNWSEGRMKW